MIEAMTVSVAAYGAVLSSALAYLAYKRERGRVKLLFQVAAGDGPYSLDVRVVNIGHRPVTISERYFVFRGEDGGLNPGELPGSAKVPTKLEDGDEIVLRYPLKTLVPLEDGVGFEVVDSRRRAYREYLTRDFLEQASAFYEHLTAVDY